jgi:hypothetical protein
VLDAYALPRFRSLNDPQPIEDDPKLVDAAIDAVKQYLFQPATSDGQPVAVWVGVRVSFHALSSLRLRTAASPDFTIGSDGRPKHTI